MEEERPSKTQRKKAMHELQSLGERLVALSAHQLEEMALPETLADAVREFVRIKSREGKRRQLQYIGRVMRDMDPEPIREKIAAWDGLSSAHIAHERGIAQWRERLMDSDGALTEFTALHPGPDTQRLRQLVRNARSERDAGRAPHSFRELYRAIRDAIETPDGG